MISIVVPAYNHHEMTAECLAAVRDNTRDYEIILVDNGSTPAIEGATIRNETNLGFPVAVNQGIRAAKGDTIILLNNDVICTPGSLNRLDTWLHNFSIVAPCTNYCAGLQQVMIALYTDRAGLDEQARQWAADYAGASQEVNWVIGFCMAFKKSLWDEIGPFDESLWPCSGEELDFCLRARAAGHRTGIAWDVYVHHIGSQTFLDLEKAGTVKYSEICARNERHVMDRWGVFWNKQELEG